VIWEVTRATARRDYLLERSYHFQLTMRYISTIFGVLMFYFIGRLVGNAAELQQYGGEYFSFALIGLIVMALANTGVRQVSRTFTGESSSRTLEILLTAPTPLGSIIAGSLVVPFALSGINVAVYLVVGFLLGGVSYTIGGSLLALPILILTVGTFVAVGITSAAFLVLTRRGEPFSTLMMQTTNVLAGTVFPVAVLPGYLQVAAHLLPAFYGLRALRAVLLSNGGLDAVWSDVLILLAFNVVLLPLAMWALHGSLRVARRLGTLASS
jgi:ABC-2 type transport system permease protein